MHKKISLKAWYVSSVQSFMSLETEYNLEMSPLSSGIEPLWPEKVCFLPVLSTGTQPCRGRTSNILWHKEEALTLAGLEINGGFPLVLNLFSWYSHSVSSQSRAGEVTRRDHLFYIILPTQARWGNTARIHFQTRDGATPENHCGGDARTPFVSCNNAKRRWCSKKQALMLYALWGLTGAPIITSFWHLKRLQQLASLT